MSKLNNKQKAFADYYIESLNATESYQKAYNCGYNTARTNGARLLTNANIKKYIDDIMEAKNESRIASQDEILQILTDIARGITEEEVVQINQLGEEIRTTKRAGIKERMKASELLARRHRMFTEKVDTEKKEAEIEFIRARTELLKGAKKDTSLLEALIGVVNK